MRYTRLVLAAPLLFLLSMGAFCNEVANETCGAGFTGGRGSYSVGDFGPEEDPDAAALEAFLQAVADFDLAATTLVDNIEDTCRSLGRDLGVSEDDMPVGDIEATCGAVADQLEEDRAAFEAANLTLVTEVEPAVCQVDYDVAAQCYADCDVTVDIEATPPRCEGGGVYVNCDVGCRGECHLPSAEVACEGQCEATCTGGCEGTCRGTCSGVCNGRCDGECDNVLDDGSCAGQRDGQCVGECDADCTGSCWGTCHGSCDGECVVDIDGGGCDGECWGTCEADVEPISCEDGELDVDASADCEAACRAEASFNAQCTEPEVLVYFEGDVEEVAVRAQIYLTALENNLPRLLGLIEDLALTVETGTELVNRAQAGLQAATNLGARAIACVALAYNVSVEVSLEVEVAVEASADVEASAGVTAE